MESIDAVIIGSGFSGLAMAMKLDEAGRDDYLILEKATEVGGTWRDNTYPGCECDVPSQVYSFSWELDTTWTRSYSRQPEIWAYLRRITDEKGLRRKIRFGTEVISTRWDEDTRRWIVQTSTGVTYDARVVVAGVGALHIPNLPVVDGAQRFAGPQFHSAQWDHDVDLTGKRVAVIGTGASAIQFVPIIAEQVAQLTVFQRTAPWVLPKADKPIPRWRRAVFEKVPGVQRAYRDALYWALESRAVGFNGQLSGMLKLGEAMCKREIARVVEDPDTRDKLTPDYRLGCKRVLQSNTYFATYNRDNVELVTAGVDTITPRGVVDADGVTHEVDVIVYGTGFHVVDSFDHLDVTGRQGRDLAKDFAANGIETYLGINVAGFPNFFFLLGPNTGLGHNSVVFMIEQQAKYVVRCLAEMDRRRAVSIEPTADAQSRFNATIQDKLKNGIWTRGGCTSWYLDSHGVNRSIWPGFTVNYWWRTRTVSESDYSWDEDAA